MADKFDVGDVIRMKKPHPCGSYEWEILRVGADFRLKCAGCGHQIMVSRKLVEKNTRQITKKSLKLRHSYGIMSNCDILLELYPYRGSTFLVSGRIRKPETIRR